MSTAYKLILLFLFIFFIVNNAKAGRAINEEGIFNGNGFSGRLQSNLVLQVKNDFFQCSPETWTWR